jgi:NAD(P)-dependent dehydrogenase (short-subunit alcohol dehydrogenase family)
MEQPSKAKKSFLGLEGKHLLVTGASGGIGLSLAKLLLEEGARVSLQYNRQEEPLLDLLKAYPNHATAYQADVRDEAHVHRLFTHVEQTFGRVDSLILNHGVFPSTDIPVTDMTLEQWHNTISVNLTGCFLFSREFLRMLKRGNCEYGNIVLVGSTSGIFGERGHIDYSSSKSGLMYGFMRTLKNEIVQIAPKGRVNTVAPGWVLTPMAKAAMEDKVVVTRVLQTIAMRKVATAEDVANAIAFLASDKVAGHISGEIMEITGGMEGRLLFEKDEVNVS